MDAFLPLLPLRGAEAVVVLFAFAWGATLGSFVNVIVHRVPRGESPLRGRSHCPGCGAAIRPRDNVPVLGWILLRGRCRDCRRPISPRYPLVEAMCGGLVACLAVAEFAGAGCLPVQAAGMPLDRIFRGDRGPIVVFLAHAILVVALVAIGLLQAAVRHAVALPTGALLALSVLATFAEPTLHPLGLGACGGRWCGVPAVDAFSEAVVGAIAGWLAGGWCRSATTRAQLCLIGGVLGWQALTIVSIVTTAIGFACPWITPHGRDLSRETGATETVVHAGGKTSGAIVPWPAVGIPAAVTVFIAVWRFVHAGWSEIMTRAGWS